MYLPHAIWTLGNNPKHASYFVMNRILFSVHHFFERVNKGQLKMVNANY